MRIRGVRMALLPAVLLAACAQPPSQAPAETAPPPLPERVYRDAARAGEAVYRVDPRRSRVLMRTGREGSMKAAGHDHVIASVDVEGLVLVSADPGRSRADLRLPLQKLVVDEPAYRERFGLEPELTQSAIEGTARNMQDKVLESNLFPWATASIRLLSIEQEKAQLDATVTVHGMSFDYRLPAAISSDPDTLTVNGSLTIRHADFGLTAFSAAGGLLRVAEDIEVVYEVVAERGFTGR